MSAAVEAPAADVAGLTDEDLLVEIRVRYDHLVQVEMSWCSRYAHRAGVDAAWAHYSQATKEARRRGLME